MTVLPLIGRRRTPTPPINHSAYICPGCHTRPLREHGPACPDAAAQQRPRLAYPAEARIFRALPVAIALSALGWAPVIAALLIWSN